MLIEALLALTLLAAGVVFFAPNEYAGKLATALSLVPLVGSGWMWLNYEATGNALLGGDMAFETTAQWIDFGPYAIQWHVGLDGVSMPLIVLTTILTTMAIISAWTPIDERESQFYGLVLLLEFGLLGVFTALDFFVWFIFWEVVLVPMYFLIAIWGGPRRKYAAIKFFVYTNIASLIMFVGFLTLVFSLGDSVTALDLPQIAQALQVEGAVGSIAGFGPETVKLFAFALMFFGFAVKVPVFPVHTWLPDAHVEAPTPISVILAGILLKMGGYGFFRIAFPFFPDAAVYFGWLLALLGVINIIYGSLCAMAQEDLKKLVAYSSIGHMGYMLLGMASFVEFGLKGGHMQMFTHGLSSGLLFMLVGVVYQRAHHRNISGFGGLASQMPYYAGFMCLATFAGLGLPGLAPFISEAFSFIGAFYSEITRTYAVIGIFGILLTASYMLWMYQRVFFGEVNEENEELPDINVREMAAALPLMVLLVVLGVYPMAYFNLINESLLQLQQMIH